MSSGSICKVMGIRSLRLRVAGIASYVRPKLGPLLVLHTYVVLVLSTRRFAFEGGGLEIVLTRVVFFLTAEAPLGIYCLCLELHLAEIYTMASIMGCLGWTGPQLPSVAIAVSPQPVLQGGGLCFRCRGILGNRRVLVPRELCRVVRVESRSIGHRDEKIHRGNSK